jgi:hypothetical protein
MDATGEMEALARRLPVENCPSPEAESPDAAVRNYIFVIVNVPFPVQPELPVKVQVPEMVLPLTFPFSASELPDGVPDCTFIPNLPFTFPLKFPLRVNDPVSVSPDAKHGEFVVKLKFTTVNEPSLFTVNPVPKLKSVVVLLLSMVAFHVPLMVAGFVLFDPHPTRVRPTASKATRANCFIRVPRIEVRSGARNDRCGSPLAYRRRVKSSTGMNPARFELLWRLISLITRPQRISCEQTTRERRFHATSLSL